jgi:hypothetical protein
MDCVTPFFRELTEEMKVYDSFVRGIAMGHAIKISLNAIKEVFGK